jgi:A118 family predicted phage portal protein
VGWREYLKDQGYAVDGTMAAAISNWWQWYTATHAWYSSTEEFEGRTFKVERISVKPARMVCQEWASLLMNERTRISTDNDVVNEFLEDYFSRTRFMMQSQGLVERAFALGTGAWAIRIEDADAEAPLSPEARVVVQRFDARYIVPLSYDESGCTECAFVSKVVIDGKRYDQIQMHHIGERKTYVIRTVFLLEDSGGVVELEGFTTEMDTGSKTPTFALIRPGLENTVVDFSPFGISVFEDAIGAVKLVDEAFDTLHNDMYLGQKMLFLDERMLTQDSSGNVIVPRQRDQQLFRKTEQPTGADKMVEEYNPDLRVDATRSAITTALEMLGTRTGFGAAYFSLEGDTGLKTATEVVAEHSDLFRNVRKHENTLTPALQTITGAVIEIERTLKGASLPEDYGDITVAFDDSVMEDTEAQRARDLREVAAMLMQPWEYRAKWYGEDEETAKAMVAGGDIPPEE